MGYGIQVIEMKALYGFPSSHLYGCSLLSSRHDLRYHLVEVQINSATISCKPNGPIVFTNLLLFPACLFTFSATFFWQVLVRAVIWPRNRFHHDSSFEAIPSHFAWALRSTKQMLSRDFIKHPSTHPSTIPHPQAMWLFAVATRWQKCGNVCWALALPSCATRWKLRWILDETTKGKGWCLCEDVWSDRKMSRWIITACVYIYMCVYIYKYTYIYNVLCIIFIDYCIYIYHILYFIIVFLYTDTYTLRPGHSPTYFTSPLPLCTLGFLPPPSGGHSCMFVILLPPHAYTVLYL